MTASLHDLFEHPGKEYSPVPFWFLNGPLDKEKLRHQLADFTAHGVHGVILHPRMGFDPQVAYLSDAYFDWMAFIVEEARKLDMYVFLYDEGMYPSGSACGQVVAEDPAYAARGLMMYTGYPIPDSGEVIARIAARITNGMYAPARARLLAAGERPLPGETLLTLVLDYSHGSIRGLLPTQDDGLPDAPPAADLLDPDAVQCFIRLTHERYYARLAPYFGTTIRAMFTDEPSPTGRCVPQGMHAWSKGMDKEWIEAGHKLTELPTLFMRSSGDSAAIREAYEALIQQRLLRVYYHPLRDWCEHHGIALTGHPAQADAIGLEEAFTIPGQDMVWRWVAPGSTSITGAESTQAHCAADSMLHSGKKRCINECFGCCGPDGSQWGMTIADIRWMLDFLFVRGTNWIAPHAFFYHMDPVISAQDRPPDVGPSNYWWPHFGAIAAYIARMSALNTETEDCADIAVLTTGIHLPWQLTAELQRNQLPFHYVTLSELKKACVKDAHMYVGDHAYRVLITPELSGSKDTQVLRTTKELVDAGMYLLSPDLGGCETIQNVVQELTCQRFAPVQFTPACEDIRVSHRRFGDQHVLMLFNEGLSDWSGIVHLPVIGTCELWNAWTGAREILTASDSLCRVQLPARQSALLITEKTGRRGTLPSPARQLETRLDLSASFALTLPDGASVPLPRLVDWQTLPGLAAFNGTLTYTAEVHLDQAPASARLSLGDVRELAEVVVNGQSAGALLLPPFAVEIGPLLHAGSNRIEVRVTSALVTAYEGKPWPCGLLGPVALAFN